MSEEKKDLRSTWELAVAYYGDVGQASCFWDNAHKAYGTPFGSAIEATQDESFIRPADLAVTRSGNERLRKYLKLCLKACP